MDKVVGDHSEPHPALHSRVSFIETAPQSVSSLENADAPLTAGPPFLSLLEPALPFFPLSLGALRAAIGKADPFNAFFVRFLFISRRVEGCVTRDQAWRASQLLLVRLNRRNQQRRVVRPLLIHLEGSDDLIFAFLDLDHLAELGGLARLALSDDLGGRLEDADQFLGHVRVATEHSRPGLLHHLFHPRRHRDQLLTQAFEGGLFEDIARCFHARRDLARKEFRLSRSEERRVGKECRSRWSPYH